MPLAQCDLSLRARFMAVDHHDLQQISVAPQESWQTAYRLKGAMKQTRRKEPTGRLQNSCWLTVSKTQKLANTKQVDS